MRSSEVAVDQPTNMEAGAAVRVAADRQSGDRRPAAPASPGWVEYLGAAGIVKILVLVALFLFVYWDHANRFFKYWQEPDWSHGFLVLPFCLYIVHLNKSKIMSTPVRGSFWGLALMIFSSVAYAYAVFAQFGYPQQLTIITMISGMIILLAGWRVFKIVLFPIGFLLLAMPPPDRLYREITQPLQQGAAAIAAAILSCFPGADIERSGVNISYWIKGQQSGTFTVAGACSGMRSLMAFVALGLAMAYFTPRPLWQRLTMAVVVIPVALTCNVLRVIITGYFQMYGHGDLAVGTPHMVLGLMTFGLGFLIFLCILWILDNLIVDAPENRAGADAS